MVGNVGHAERLDHPALPETQALGPRISEPDSARAPGNSPSQVRAGPSRASGPQTHALSSSIFASLSQGFCSQPYTSS